MTAAATCPTCAQPGEIVLRPGQEATVGTVAVVLERRPAVACAQEHDLTPAVAVGAAMDATEAAIPRARRRLGRGGSCLRCRTALTMPVRRAHRVVSVEHEALPVLTLRFDLPLTRCPDCGLDQLPRRSQEDLVVSVPAVFASQQPPTQP